jgi:eukaryotic-like serine/threonine-protein kinase
MVGLQPTLSNELGAGAEVETRVLGKGGQEPATPHRYQILRKLATGGMGEVFVARDRSVDGTERLVALKILLPHLGDDPGYLQMFVDEARMVARLSHPNILPVLDIGSWNHRFFMAMPLVDGASVGSLIAGCLRENRQAPLEVVREIGLRLCNALTHAHTRRGDQGQPDGIIHRDVSPPNVLLSRKGEVLLTDFGVAKAASNVHQTKPGAVLGKLSYMPPEQIENSSQVDARSDVYSTGVTLYELLTHSSPYARSSDAATLMAVVRGGCPDAGALRPDATPGMLRALKRALSSQPDHRPATIQELREEFVDGPCSGPEGLARFLEELFPAQSADANPAPDQPLRTATLSGHNPPTALWPQPTHTESSAVVTSQTRVERRARWQVVALSALGAFGVLALLTWGNSGTEPTASRTETPRPALAKEMAPPPPTKDPADSIEGLSLDLRADTLTSTRAPPREAARRTKQISTTSRPKPASALGFVSLDATPWAVVSEGGKRIDETPIVRHPLSVGEHTLVFENAELGKRVKRQVQIQEGKLRVVRVSFE